MSGRFDIPPIAAGHLPGTTTDVVASTMKADLRREMDIGRRSVYFKSSMSYKSALLDYLVYGEGTKRGVQRGVQKKGGYKKGGVQKKRGYKKKGVQKKGVQKKGGYKKKGVQKKGVQKKGGYKKRGGVQKGGYKKGGYKKVPKSFSRGPTEGTVEIFFMFNNKFRVSWCYGFFCCLLPINA